MQLNEASADPGIHQRSLFRYAHTQTFALRNEKPVNVKNEILDASYRNDYLY